jgi:uncharacterized protein YbjT (DUF2867 family)
MELNKIAILGVSRCTCGALACTHIMQPGGNVGSAVITHLLRSWPGSDITAITRQTSSYSPPPDSGILHKKANYQSFDALVDAFAGQDAVVNCITGIATQYDPSKRIVDAAVAADVKFFFANEFVANMESEQARRLPESHAGAKYRIREYLKGLGSEGKIAWTGLNGGPFFDMCKRWPMTSAMPCAVCV